MNAQPEPAIDLFVQAVLAKKARSVVVLDVHDLTAIADYFIICSGSSNRQVSAIAEHIKLFLKEHNIKPLSVEGLKEGHWVLMDYGDVLIHVFYEETRSFYDLEGLWVDAKRVTTESLKGQAAGDQNGFSGKEIIVE